MDTAQWPQEIAVKPIEEIVTNCGGVLPPGSHGKPLEGQQQRKPRPVKEQALNCPRCNSTNTKFCYYNNYSLTQPRYFCKTCRRYWTEGGSLRSIPVGGGSRKNKRPNSSTNNSFSTSNSSSSTTTTTTNTCSSSKIGQNPSKTTQDLNLSFPPELLHLVPNAGITNNNMEKGLMSSFMSMPLSVPDHHHGLNNYTTPPPPGIFHNFQDMKPNLSFSLDGLGAYRNPLPDTSGGRMLFPFEELKVSSSTSIDVEQQNNGDHQQQQQGSDHHHHQSSNGYWSGMLGGGTW